MVGLWSYGVDAATVCQQSSDVVGRPIVDAMKKDGAKVELSDVALSVFRQR